MWFHQLWRLWQINAVFIHYGVDELIPTTPFFSVIRILLRVFSGLWKRDLQSPRGVRLRLALETLGPIFVKFGQLFSTRPDIFPADIVSQLSRLQDKVPPFSGLTAKALVEAAFQFPLEQVFLSFDLQPLASASIAQVHQARLLDGTEVVVKILRPGIEKVIKRDLQLLKTLARCAEMVWVDGRRLRPTEVVSDYAITIMNELDLLREAGNTSQLKRNFDQSSLLYVPTVFWDLCRANILVMERIYGIAVTDNKALLQHGIDLKSLAERGVEIFFRQVFTHRFFHADMHPGNIFVAKENPDKPQYIAIDCGIIGTLSVADQSYLTSIFLAFFDQDYRRIAELYLASGWVPSGTRLEDFEAAIRTVSEPIFQRPLKDISFGQLLLRLFVTARRFNMSIQPQLVLLQKTLLNVEGLGRQLYPELDLWSTAKPFLEKWMRQQASLSRLVKQLREAMPQILGLIPQVPGALENVLQQQRVAGQLAKTQAEALQYLRKDMRRMSLRNFWALICISGLIALTLVLSS